MQTEKAVDSCRYSMNIINKIMFIISKHVSSIPDQKDYQHFIMCQTSKYLFLLHFYLFIAYMHLVLPIQRPTYFYHLKALDFAWIHESLMSNADKRFNNHWLRQSRQAIQPHKPLKASMKNKPATIHQNQYLIHHKKIHNLDFAICIYVH